MSKIKAELKRALAALAYQDATDYLSESEKSRVLGVGSAGAAMPSGRVSREDAAILHRRKRIALITDGRGDGAPTAFAADACRRQEAGLDIVLHGEGVSATALVRMARRLGIDPQVIKLAGDDVELFVEYVCNHPSLVYLVGISDDDLVRALAERVVPARGGRLHVPLVMIEDRPARNADLLATGSL
jgi:hypothetical protein